eukprot:TRINITY_DN47900_c0_g1_i1.p1 TRINITY_DN47900_c0_g1~~TRINITY_DN47900_c0_g1_i1.p1  ORF type:complete len:647 (+),score=161.54 TRINITY_DN47900_c0_g1_i1:83-1942(+)
MPPPPPQPGRAAPCAAAAAGAAAVFLLAPPYLLPTPAQPHPPQSPAPPRPQPPGGTLLAAGEGRLRAQGRTAGAPAERTVLPRTVPVLPRTVPEFPGGNPQPGARPSADRPVGLWYFYDEAHNHTAWMFRTSLGAVEPRLQQHSIFVPASEARAAPGWSFLVKTRSILAVCAAHPGQVVLYSDTDIVFFRPFLDDIEALMMNTSAEILFQGFPHPFTGRKRRKMINIGFMALRCTESVVRLWRATYRRVADEEGRWIEGRCDQPELQHKSGLTAAWPRWDFFPPRYWISSLVHPRQGALKAQWAAVPRSPILCHPDSASGTVKLPREQGKVPWKIHFIADQVCGRACSSSSPDCYSPRRPLNDPYQAYTESPAAEAAVLLLHTGPRRATGWGRWAALLSLRRHEPALRAAAVQVQAGQRGWCAALSAGLRAAAAAGLPALAAVGLPGLLLVDGALSRLLGRVGTAGPAHSLVALSARTGVPVVSVARADAATADFWDRCELGELHNGGVAPLGAPEGVLVTSSGAAAPDPVLCVADDVDRWVSSGRVPPAYANRSDWAGMYVTTALRCGAPAPDPHHDWQGLYLPPDVLPAARRGPSPDPQRHGPPATGACGGGKRGGR